MLPTKPVRLQLGELLAADPTTLAPAASGNKIALVIASFVEDESLTLADLTLATFDGNTPLVAGIGVQLVGLDPATGDQIITIKDPAGGFRWEVTGTTLLPQVVYGFVLMDNAAVVLLAMQTINPPVSLTDVGQEVNLGAVKMRLNASPIS